MPMSSEPSYESEHLEQSGETVSLSNQTLPQHLRLYRTALPAQVTTSSSAMSEYAVVGATGGHHQVCVCVF